MDNTINSATLSMKTPVFVDTQSKMTHLSMKSGEFVDKLVVLPFLSTKQGHVMDGKVSLFVKMPRAVLRGKRLRSIGFHGDLVHLKHKSAQGLFCLVSDEELFLSLRMFANRLPYE